METHIRDAKIISNSSIGSTHDSTWGESNTWVWENFRCQWRFIGKENQKSILLLHGFGASSRHWRKNAEDFAAAGFRVFGLDLIGFGESEQPAPNKINMLDNQFWSNQVSAFLEEIVEVQKYGKTILIGNSLGSLVALTTLYQQPKLISALIAAPLPDPAFMEADFFKWPNTLQKISRLFFKVFFRLLPLELFVPLISRTFLIKAALQGAYFHSIKNDHELYRIVAKPAQQKTAARALRAMCIGMTLRKNEAKAPFMLKQIGLRKNRAPFLLIWGIKDQLVPLKLGKELVRTHPWLNLYVLDKTGHCPHDESPKEFNRIVLNWLEKTLPEDRKQV